MIWPADNLDQDDHAGSLWTILTQNFACCCREDRGKGLGALGVQQAACILSQDGIQTLSSILNSGNIDKWALASKCGMRTASMTSKQLCIDDCFRL